MDGGTSGKGMTIGKESLDGDRGRLKLFLNSTTVPSFLFSLTSSDPNLDESHSPGIDDLLIE